MGYLIVRGRWDSERTSSGQNSFWPITTKIYKVSPRDFGPNKANDRPPPRAFTLFEPGFPKRLGSIMEYDIQRRGTKF